MRTIAEIQQELSVKAEEGLTPEAVKESRQKYGQNQLTPLPREPLWKKFIGMFEDPIIKILLAAALLSMVVDLFKVAPVVAGASLGVIVVAFIGAFVARLGQWIPTMMFVIAILLFLVGLIDGHVLVEGMAVMVAVILATGVAFLSEYRSDREFELLNAQKESTRTKVIRGGEFHTVPIEEVVVGDVVSLEMGDEVPADGRLAKATELYIDQSLMTGESEPVHKVKRPPDDTADGPEQPGCLYRGTQVVDGVGQLVVTEVGDETYLGQIARRLSADDGEDEEADEQGDTEEKRVKHKLTISKELTPLQVKLTHLAELISKVGYIAAIAIFVAQIIRGIIFGDLYWPGTQADFGTDLLNVFGELLGYFVVMVIIIVVAVPEGLPMSVTVSLALAMQKMTRANSLVRQLVACETIGSATVICSDKTGTLTQNKMRVDRTSWEGHTHDRNSPDWSMPDADRSWPRDGKPQDWFVLNAAVNSTANLEEKDGKLIPVGNSTEAALLQWIKEANIDYRQLRKQFDPVYQVHFSSERKRMTTVISYGDRLLVLAKGAPEFIIDLSSQYQAGDGTVRDWDDQAREAVKECLRDSTAQAMRTLAFAYAWLPEGTPTDEESLHERREELEKNLVYVGFVGIRDPLRDDVVDAINQCRDAGIEVKMITGDNVETARAIGFDIGLIESRDVPIDSDDGVILTSAKFNEMSDDEVTACLPRLRILARARPLDKFRMVRLLQEQGEVVAVTGDGTNDAPALKKADVGLAMGIAGTEVSKEASKIVLLDDAFSTIVKAVHWGRSLYENIQRFIQFQLTINVSALTITFLGILLFGVKAPFTVLQLLWINVIMDTFAAIALCSEPPRLGLMKMPPKKKDENILSPSMIRSILVTGSFFVVVMLVLLIGMKGDPENPGWFAPPDGPWFAEVAGSRIPVLASDLEKTDGKWAIAESTKLDDTITSRTAVVSFTVFQVSLFFSIYVFYQVWNQINCRSLTPDTSGFSRIWQNPTFIAIASTVAIGQILIVTFGGKVFAVEALSPLTWLAIIAFTSTVLIFVEVARFVRLRIERGKSSPTGTSAPNPDPVS